MLYKNKQSLDNNKKLPPWERPLFIIVMTFVGGYMNAYTYITRNKILANMHTDNMSMLGINIALGHWKSVLSLFITISTCLLGAAFGHYIKYVVEKHKFSGDWRKIALVLQSIAFFLIGFVSREVSNLIVTNIISFVMGYQLCLFKKCLDVSFSTTICTGNIRNVGELFYYALAKRDNPSIRKFLIFATLTFSFSIGAIPGTLFSMILGIKSIWICSFILLCQVFWMNKYELKNNKSIRA